MDVFRENSDDILLAFGRSLELIIAAGVIAMLVGSFLAALRVSPIWLGRTLGSLYVSTVRNTPLLLIMLIAAFGVPELDIRPAVSLGDATLLQFNFFFMMAMFSLGLYTASFVCEALRSGINAIPLGQAEAARSIGMTFGQTLRHVILPQAFRLVIPPITNVLIAMAKNSSVALAVGVTEATFQMNKLINDNTSALYSLFIGFALFYIAIVAVISVVSSLIERRVKVAS
ncbi:amino acid ABC transporter permease [soil metagenome]